jgi:uncharacterized cupredoxin-like copper-binding protein
MVAGALASCVALLAAGCGGGHTGGGRVVHITERDFKIVAPAHVAAGEVTLQVRNDGPDDHELIMVRDADAALPLRTDGLTVDENALRRVTVVSLDPGTPGSVRRVRVHLTPGRYELLCNMAGHYMGGMHTVLTVS